MRMTPPNPPSSRPTACNSVDLPEPEGPSSATISPRCNCPSMPRSTSIVTPAWVKLRRRPVRERVASVIAQHLHRIGVRGLERGIERREEAEQDRHHRDADDLDRIGLRRQFGQEADRGRSEEHTSELQSLMRISYAVFCLKKKK